MYEYTLSHIILGKDISAAPDLICVYSRRSDADLIYGMIASLQVLLSLLSLSFGG